MSDKTTLKTPIPWLDGAETVEIELLRPVMVRTDVVSVGPWLTLERGLYTLKRRAESGNIYDVLKTKGGYLTDVKWKFQLNGGYIKILKIEK